jgi:crotonobetainyl-CoA:carnitine CoA-transferase CaiB-like acyl-CoA transferase
MRHWEERLGQNDVPFAPIHRIEEVVRDPQVEHLGVVVPVAAAHGGKHAVRPAIQFDGVRATQVATAPLLDEHGPAIRKVLANGADWPQSNVA